MCEPPPFWQVIGAFVDPVSGDDRLLQIVVQFYSVGERRYAAGFFIDPDTGAVWSSGPFGKGRFVLKFDAGTSFSDPRLIPEGNPALDCGAQQLQQ